MPSTILSVDLSPGGDLVAVAGSDQVIKLIETATGRERHTLKGHSGIIRSVTFSPDGKMLASGGSDDTIRLWNLSKFSGKD